MTCQLCGASSGHMPGCRELSALKITTSRGDLVVTRDGHVSVTGDPLDLSFWSHVLDAADECELGSVARLACSHLATVRLVEERRNDLEKYSRALAEVAELPGPHYSAATKNAVGIAKRALGG